MSNLVEFQKRLFEHIDELHRIGEEGQFVRFSSSGKRFILDSNDVSGAYLLPRIIAIPSTSEAIVGAVQLGGQVWTVFDFAFLMDSNTTTQKTSSSKVLTIAPHLATGVALLVDQTFSMVPHRLFYDSGESFVNFPWTTTTFLNDEDGSSWNGLDVSKLMESTVFSSKTLMQ